MFNGPSYSMLSFMLILSYSYINSCGSLVEYFYVPIKSSTNEFRSFNMLFYIDLIIFSCYLAHIDWNMIYTCSTLLFAEIFYQSPMFFIFLHAHVLDLWEIFHDDFSPKIGVYWAKKLAKSKSKFGKQGKFKPKTGPQNNPDLAIPEQPNPHLVVPRLSFEPKQPLETHSSPCLMNVLCCIMSYPPKGTYDRFLPNHFAFRSMYLHTD